MTARKVMFLVSSLALTTAEGTDQVNGRSVFVQLQTLVGEWEGKTETGRVLKVSFRLTANKTVLVETWSLGPQRESLTLYHMDNESLIATHYCTLGNQPRLQLKGRRERVLVHLRVRLRHQLGQARGSAPASV